MTTYNTGNPLGSAAAKDLYDNAENLDHLSLDMANEVWPDRLGRPRKTWHGIEKNANQAIKNYGYITLKSFQLGAPLSENKLTLPNQVLLDESDGEYYRWDGPLPKVVSPSSTPESTGGIGPGAWLSVGDAALRAALNSEVGYSSLGEFNSIDELRSYSSYASLASGSRVSVKSYYSGLGYGGGFFRWNATSTDADDAGYTINPTGNSGPGRWKRENSDSYSVRTVSPLEFGAKLNDSTFDSVVAINVEISYLNPYINKDYDQWTGGDVILDAGKYYINDTIYGAPNVRLIGTGGVPGFGQTMNGATSISSMPTMTLTKLMFDTAPWLTDNSSRYKKTDE